MYRDLSDLRARFHVQEDLMKAVQETASDQHRTLVRLETTQIQHTAILDEHSRILNEHSRNLDEHTGILAKLQAGMKMIVGLLGGDAAVLDTAASQD